jgi:hypothetical protein
MLAFFILSVFSRQKRNAESRNLIQPLRPAKILSKLAATVPPVCQAVNRTQDHLDGLIKACEVDGIHCPVQKCRELRTETFLPGDDVTWCDLAECDVICNDPSARGAWCDEGPKNQSAWEDIIREDGTKGPCSEDAVNEGPSVESLSSGCVRDEDECRRRLAQVCFAAWALADEYSQADCLSKKCDALCDKGSFEWCLSTAAAIGLIILIVIVLLVVVVAVIGVALCCFCSRWTSYTSLNPTHV